MALNLKKRLVVGRELTYEEVDGNWTDIEAAIANRAPLTHTHAISAITGLQAALDSFIPLSQKAANSGVAPLDVNGKVPLVHLPDLGATANDMIFPTESITSADVGKIATFKNGFAQLPTFEPEAAQVMRVTFADEPSGFLDIELPHVFLAMSSPEEDDSITLSLYTTANTKSDFTFVYKDAPSGNLELASGGDEQDFIDHFEAVRTGLNIHPLYTLSLSTYESAPAVLVDAELIDYTDDDFWENTAVSGSLSLYLFGNTIAERLNDIDFTLWPLLVSCVKYTLPDGDQGYDFNSALAAFLFFEAEDVPEGSDWGGPYYLTPAGDKKYYISDRAEDMISKVAFVFAEMQTEISYDEFMTATGFDVILPYYATGVEFDVPTEEQTRFEDAFGTPEIVNPGNPPYNDAPILGQITAVVGSNVYISSQPIRSYLLKGENSVGFEPEGDPPLPGFSIGRLLVLDHENAGYLRSGLDYGLGPWLSQVAQFGCLQAIGAAEPDEQARAILTNSTALISLVLTIG
jgi:hypothetical protein